MTLRFLPKSIAVFVVLISGGEAFDLRRFHNAVLDNGPLPLNILEQQIEQWGAAEKTADVEGEITSLRHRSQRLCGRRS